MNEAPAGYMAELFASCQGEGPWAGYRQLFARLAGCSRRCDYCDTPASRTFNPKIFKMFVPIRGLKRCGRGSGPTVRLATKTEIRPNPISALHMADILMHWVDDFGPFYSLAVTGGEPLEQRDFLFSLLKRVKVLLSNLLIFIETNGVKFLTLSKIRPYVDFISADVKLPSATRQPLSWPAFEKFLGCGHGVDGCVKAVITPGTRAAEVMRAARLAWRRVPGWDFVLQPVAHINWRLARNHMALERIATVARTFHGRVRVLPQIHVNLGMK